MEELKEEERLELKEITKRLSDQFGIACFLQDENTRELSPLDSRSCVAVIERKPNKWDVFGFGPSSCVKMIDKGLKDTS